MDTDLFAGNRGVKPNNLLNPRAALALFGLAPVLDSGFASADRAVALVAFSVGSL